MMTVNEANFLRLAHSKEGPDRDDIASFVSLVIKGYIMPNVNNCSPTKSGTEALRKWQGNHNVDGAQQICNERLRQIHLHRYDEQHDDTHTNNELLDAAMALLAHEIESYTGLVYVMWPWELKSLDSIMTNTKIERLVKAGALIAAEIDRLQRAGG